jgi:hypothetical protein
MEQYSLSYVPLESMGTSLWQRVGDIILRRPSSLVDMEALAKRIQMSNRHDMGYQAIPVAQIVGSVGRHKDFRRNFVPRLKSGWEKYGKIARLYEAGKTLPPIEVYQIGELYFVIDGNHRVAVNRARGVEFIDAHVIQIEADVEIRTTAEARAIYQNTPEDRT